MIIKDATGKEVEVFTQQEVDEKTKAVGEESKKTTEEAVKKASDEAIETYKKDHPDQTKDFEDLKTKLTEAEDKLKEVDSGGDDDDDGQKKRLREQRDKAMTKLGDAMEKMGSEITELKTSIVGDTKGELLSALAGDDDELKKKIEFEFDHYRVEDTSKLAIKERLEKAFQLATGDAPKPGIFDGAVTGSGSQKGDGNEDETEGVMTENAKAIGKKLGITDEQVKAYEERKAKEAKEKAAAS